MLSIRSLNVAYGGLRALSDVSLEVAKGQFVAVVGANGAGKSTLFKTISGTVAPVSGAIAYNGRDLLTVSPAERAQLGIAHVPEGRQVFPELSVIDNIRLGAYASLQAREITVDFARETLAAFVRQTQQHLSVETVQKVVATYYGVRVADLRSQRRDKRVSHPRQVAMYLARKLTASYPDLGQRFGGKDHSTVISACRKIENLLRTQASLRHEVESIETGLQG